MRGQRARRRRRTVNLDRPAGSPENVTPLTGPQRNRTRRPRSPPTPRLVHRLTRSKPSSTPVKNQRPAEEPDCLARRSPDRLGGDTVTSGILSRCEALSVLTRVVDRNHGGRGFTRRDNRRGHSRRQCADRSWGRNGPRCRRRNRDLRNAKRSLGLILASRAASTPAMSTPSTPIGDSARVPSS